MALGYAAVLYPEVNCKVSYLHVMLGSFDLATVYFSSQLSLSEEEDLDEPRVCHALLAIRT